MTVIDFLCYATISLICLSIGRWYILTTQPWVFLHMLSVRGSKPNGKYSLMSLFTWIGLRFPRHTCMLTIAAQDPQNLMTKVVVEGIDGSLYECAIPINREQMIANPADTAKRFSDTLKHTLLDMRNSEEAPLCRR